MPLHVVTRISSSDRTTCKEYKFHIKSLDKYTFSHCLLDTRVFPLKPNSIVSFKILFHTISIVNDATIISFFENSLFLNGEGGSDPLKFGREESEDERLRKIREASPEGSRHRLENYFQLNASVNPPLPPWMNSARLLSRRLLAFPGQRVFHEHGERRRVRL